MNEQNAILKQDPKDRRVSIPITNRGLLLTNLDDMWRFSNMVVQSGLAPKGISTPAAVAVAIQMGAECAMTPMASLQNIAVINGRPSIWGDAQLGIVRNTGELEEFEEWFECGGKRLIRNPSNYTDDTTAVCRVKRRGYPPREVGFSVADAKAANLWNKEGPWRQYAWRMLRMRARSFALRDEFGDALRGFRSTEEIMDAPAYIHSEQLVKTLPSFTDAPKNDLPTGQSGHPEPRVEQVEEATSHECEVSHDTQEDPDEIPMHNQPSQDPPPARRKGRPPGSRNKPKQQEEATEEATIMPQDELQQLIESEGFTFDQLRKWNDESGFVSPMSRNGFADIPYADAAKLRGSIDGLLKSLTRMFSGEVAQ